MMSPLDVFTEPVWQRLTWTLLHFLWQGLAVAVLLAAVLRWFPVRRARPRYATCLAGMLVMAACPLVTFALLGADAEDAAAAAGRRSPTGASRDVGVRSSLPAEGRHDTTDEVVVSRGPVGLHEGAVAEDQAAVDRPAVSVDQPVAAQKVGLRPSLRPLHRFMRAVQPYLLAGWIAGVVALGGRLLLGQMGVQWLRRGRRPISAELVSCVARLGERLGLRAFPRVFVSEKVREAVVVGLLRPMVLLPACWLTEMTPEVLEAVIAHELAHVRRWDLWVNLLQRLMETLLFYQPAVWWVSRRVRLEREMCCDELAVAATGERMAYVTALSQAALRRAVRNKPLLGATMGGAEMTLLSRVHNVLGLSPGRERARWWPAGLVALSVPLVIWAASTGVGRPGLGEARAEREEAPGATAAPQAYRVRPFDLLAIKVLGTLLDYPIDQTYFVDPAGDVAMGRVYGRVQLRGLTLQEAEGAIEEQLQKVIREPKVQVTWTGRVTTWHSVAVQQTSDRITPPTFLRLQVTGTLTDRPIDGEFLVDPNGQIALGPTYGMANVKGLTVEQAERAVAAHLGQFLKEPKVSASLISDRRIVAHHVLPTSPHRITTADLLDVQVLGTLLDWPISGTYLLEASGKLALGPAYGRVRLQSLTLREAEVAIENHLKQVLREPKASVSLAGWKSDQEQTTEERLRIRDLEEEVQRLKTIIQRLGGSPRRIRDLEEEVQRLKTIIQSLGGSPRSIPATPSPSGVPPSWEPR